MVLRYFLVFFITFHILFSLEIKLNYGYENNKNYTTLNIKNENAFTCIQNTDADDVTTSIICEIEGVPQSGFNATKTIFFDFSYEVIEKYVDPDKTIKKTFTIIKIIPNKKNIKLVSHFVDIKNDIALPVGRKNKAKSYQIIGYEDEIPFLNFSKNTHNRNKINFPIRIKNVALPIVNELDINSKPLNYKVGRDLEIFLDIKKSFKRRDYKNVLNLVSKSIKQLQNSIFTKDIVYYGIVSLANFYNDNGSKKLLIERASDWIKAYPSDVKIPEVMYYLAKTFITENKIKDGVYYLNRIIDDYPDSDFTPLAQVQIANILKSPSDLKRAPLFYRDAYKKSKNVNVASEVALNWARFNLVNGDNKNAISLVNKVFEAKPTFFLLDPTFSESIGDEFAKYNEFHTAGRIIKFLSQNTSIDTEKHEYLLNKAAKYYTDAKDYEEANILNELIIDRYPNGKFVNLAKSRKDEIVFDLSGSDDEKLQRYEQVVLKYPGSEESKRAYILMAEILLRQKKYENVLNLIPVFQKLNFDSDENKKIERYIELSVKNQVLLNLTNHNCAGISDTLRHSDKLDLDSDRSLEVFECLMEVKNFQKADSLYGDLYKKINDGNKQLKWLYLRSKLLFALDNKIDAIKAGYDAIDLAYSTNEHKYYDISYDIFDHIIDNSARANEAIKLSYEMDKWFPNDVRMLDVHFKLLKLAEKNKDNLSIKNEVYKIIELQKTTNRNDFSPFVDFYQAEILLQENKDDEALAVFKYIEKMPLNDNDKQKLLYKEANILYSKNENEKSLTVLNECIGINSSSAWGNLCVNAKNLQEGTIN